VSRNCLTIINKFAIVVIVKLIKCNNDIQGSSNCSTTILNEFTIVVIFILYLKSFIKKKKMRDRCKMLKCCSNILCPKRLHREHIVHFHLANYEKVLPCLIIKRHNLSLMSETCYISPLLK